MNAAAWVLVISATIPLARAWRVNRFTTLGHALGWAVAAWAVWTASFAGESQAAGYLALALSGCAGVAVLGARRPGAGAWNFVTAGLLTVLMVPLAEAGVLDAPLRLGAMRMVFLACLLGMIVINYLPTRLFGSALAMGLGCGLEMGRLSEEWPVHVPAVCCIGFAPWLGWLGLHFRSKSASEVDRAWRRFRDRYGLIWGWRVREQFNSAAANAGRNVQLRWSGLVTRDGQNLDPGTADFAANTLAALTKRFGSP